MKLSPSLYQHLVTLKVFEPAKVLSPTQQVLVENGIAIAKLLRSISAIEGQRPTTPIMQLDQLKQITTSSTKLYNWNIIIQAMNALRIPNELNADIKKLIIMGDQQIIEEQLNYLYSYYLKLMQNKQTLQRSQGSPLQRSRILSENSGYYSEKQNSNILEFFTQIISKQLSLQVKQVLTLYSDNFKFWAQVVTKGVQRVYEPIVGVYKDVFQYVEHLQNLILMDRDKGLKFSLNLLKPGLLSKSSDVAVETIKCFGKFVISAHKNYASLIDDTHKWYVENCFQTTLLSIKRHPQLVDSLVDMMLLFCKNYLVELFTLTLKQHSANLVDMLVTVEKLFNSLTPEYLLEINSIGIMQQWLDQSLEGLETPSLKNDEKIALIRLITHIWLKEHDQFARSQAEVHKALKNSALDPSHTVALHGSLLIMQLLEHFGKNKVAEAPILYKMLAIIIVECKDDTVVNFILMNLQLLFQQLPSMPLSVVLDPLITQLQEKAYPSLVVFQFLTNVSQNPNLSLKSQIHLMDLMSKISIQDTLHYKIAMNILMYLIQNSVKQPSTQEFIIKFVKISLAVYYSVSRKASPKKGAHLAIENQRKAQIIEVLKQIVGLQNQEINEIVKMMAGHTNLQFKFLQKPNKGLQSLLMLLGDVSEIMSQVEQEYKQQELQKQTYSESSVKEVQLVQSSLQKYSKHNKIKLTKEEQYHLARLRMSKEADPKVLEDIQTIKKQFHVKKEQANQQQVEHELMQKVQKERLRKQLEKRQIEQGISSLNKKDVVVQLIFPDGSRQSELVKEKKHGLPVFELLDLSLEEDVDKLLVDQLMKKYQKVFRYIFTKFANSSTRVIHPNSFEQLKQKTETINLAELIKLAHEYEIALTNEQIQALCRQVGLQILKTKNEFREFDYQGFQQFIIQLAIVLQNKRIASLQPFQCLQSLLNHLRSLAASRGQNTQLFDDPESMYFKENDIIKEFNLRLAVDPNYQLPEAYQKVAFQEINYSYGLGFVPDEERVPYEIFDDILYQALGIHIIEPVSEKVAVFKAKPNAFGYIQSKIQQEPKDEMYTIKHKSVKEREVAVSKKKVLEIEPKRELSLNMKMAIAEYNFRDRPIAEQVANLLFDMLLAVEHNRQTILRTNEISNKVIEDKKQQQAQDGINEMIREQKRKEREKQLKEKLKEQREFSQKRQEEDQKERINRSKTEYEKLKQEKEKKAKHLSELKQKIQDKQEKNKEEQLRKLLEQKERNEKDFQDKKQKFKEFNLQQITKLKKIIQNNQESKTVSLKQQEEDRKKQQMMLQQARSKILTQEQSRVQREKLLDNEIRAQFKSEAFQKIFEKFAFSLSYLFQFLVKETFFPVGKPASLDQITFKTFGWFTDRFNICPEIVTKDYVLMIYRYLTKDKEIVDGVPIGMNFEEFLMSLHRIAIKGSRLLNQAKHLDLKSIQKVVEAEQVVQPEPQSQSPKAESILVNTPVRNKSKSFLENSVTFKELQDDFSKTSEKTLDALLLYLDISNDKNQMDLRFRKVLEEKKIPNKLRRKNLRDKLGIQN